MPKSASTIVLLVRQYDDLDHAGQRLHGAGCNDDPRYIKVCNEMTDLESRIIATRAMNAADIAAKRSFLKKVGAVHADELLAMIHQLDAEAVDAAT